MNPENFVGTFYNAAAKAERYTGVPALFSLAQSALESGWGKHAPNNMLFGVKVGSGKSFGGWQGDRQLITTTEYGNTPNLKFPEILPGYPKQEGNKWKYLVKDYFRAYPSPLYTFMDWAGMLSKSARYSNALPYRNDPFRFADEVAKAGYATDPNYAQKVKKIMLEIAPLFQSYKQASTSWPTLMIILLSSGVVLLATGIVWSLVKQKKTSR